jgi:hypothetical protein
VDSDVTCDMVSLCAGHIAIFPLAGQTQIICRFASDMVVAKMHIKILRIVVCLRASYPLANDRSLSVFAVI